jgi:hypothetical protein
VSAFHRSKSPPLPSMREGLPLSPPPSWRRARVEGLRTQRLQIEFSGV